MRLSAVRRQKQITAVFRRMFARQDAFFGRELRGSSMYSFWKFTPGGNPTILLKAGDVPPEKRAAVANAVMDAQHIGAEQTGYVRLEGKPRLDMMGGEFCLNATRSFAVLLAAKGLLMPEGDGFAGPVEVSGVKEDVAVRVFFRDDDLPFAEACLHFRRLPEPEHLSGDLTLVRVPGIAHIIQEGVLPAADELPEFCRRQRLLCGVEKEKAAGHLWISFPEEHSDAGTKALSLRPVVWVRDTNSLCSESACGSGTLACALAMHARSGAERYLVRQPSGCSLSVSMQKKDDGWDVWVGGPVRMTACGQTDLTGIL